MKKIFMLLLLLSSFNPDLISQSVVVKNPVRYLALGDSYTIGQSVKEEERWPNQLVKLFRSRGVNTEELTIIAQTGWRTDNLADAIASRNPDSNYNLVSLLIGVNNQYQGISIDLYPVEFRQLLEKAIALCGGNKQGVFVLSIPDYGYTPFGLPGRESISSEIDRYNQINRQITEEMGIAYFDITPISREAIDKPEYIADDALHPSGIMYARWVELIVNSSEMIINTTNSFDKSQYKEEMVYPNPANDYLIIQPPAGALSIEIYNSTGVKLYHSEFSSTEKQQIDIREWKQGIYFFRIKLSMLGNISEDISGKFLIG